MQTMLQIASMLLLSGVALGHAQLPPAEGDEDVGVTLQNTMTAPVKVVAVSEQGQETVVINLLKPGYEVIVSARPGDYWRAKIGETVFAEYDVNDNEEQTVDRAGSWQLPVKVIVQNDTVEPVSIYFLDAQDNEVELCPKLGPNLQLDQPDVVPRSLLRVKRGDRVVGEYLVDNLPLQIVPLTPLQQVHASEVTLTFQNTTSHPVDIYWGHPDGSPQLFHPQLPPGNRSISRAFQVTSGSFMRTKSLSVHSSRAANGNRSWMSSWSPVN